MSRCWIWYGYVAPSGYGQKGRNTLVHWVYFEAFHGPVPEGYVIHHVCENRLCFNPAHLVAMPRGEHVRHHRAVSVCPKCGSTRPRYQLLLRGRPNGTRCRDCHSRRETIRTRERRAAA